MHNKFCVIDSLWTITGSYNWSDKAESNYENALFLENADLAKQYLQYFDRLKEKAYLVTDFKSYVQQNKKISNENINEFETQSNQLASEFEEAVMSNLNNARRYILVNFGKIEDNIQLYSAVGSARIYCNDKKIQSGLRQLKEKGHLELSFEWLVLQPQFSTLFNDTTKRVAREKLIECKYIFPDYMV